MEPANPYLYRLVGLLKRFGHLWRSVRLHRVVLGAKPDDALYIGEGDSLAYLSSLHHSSSVWELEPISLGMLPSEIGEKRGKYLLYLELNRLLSMLVPPGCFLTLPWVRQRIRLNGPDYRSRVSSIEGVYGRKVRRFGFFPQFTQDQRELEEFYHEFYCPYILDRFGGMAHLRSYGELSAAMRSGFLIKVLQKDQWVSGAVCPRYGAEVKALVFGLRGDYTDLLARGALSATYYFLIKWALDHSMEKVDLLRCRPHIRDGVFVHKRRFGATPHLDSWPHSAIWVFPSNNALQAECAQGLIVWHQGRPMPLDEACIRYRGTRSQRSRLQRSAESQR
jgi:hypothetical protein